MSLARRHRDRVLAETSATAILSVADGNPLRPVGAGAADHAAAQIMLRLTVDLRRLKEIHSIERKIEAKREMLPEYTPWVEGILAAGVASGRGVAEDVLPTMMIWRIDTGDFAGAMPLIEHVLRHDVPLPARYARSAPAFIVEQVAIAALKAQKAGEPFDLDMLEQIETLTAHVDMHDEIRAKMMKAIGAELVRQSDAIDAASPEYRIAAERALVPLKRAQALHDRSGVTTQMKRLEKALAATAAVFPPAPPAPEPAAPPAA
jgi:hypothetical protein